MDVYQLVFCSMPSDSMMEAGMIMHTRVIDTYMHREDATFLADELNKDKRIQASVTDHFFVRRVPVKRLTDDRDREKALERLEKLI